MPPPENDIWTRAARDADVTVELPGGVPMFFRRIPAGSFLMGSRGYSLDEEPRHRVVITRDFYLGTFPVTQEQYRAVASRCPELKENPDPSYFKGARRPVEQVSWDDVCAFCAWLQAWEELPKTIAEVRLPTEAEWEYACRAGTDTEYYNGDGEAAMAEVAWCAKDSSMPTHPVGERPETHPFGVYGMHGDVWEWCRDVYRADAYRRHVDVVLDPVELPGADDYCNRVTRGGSWYFISLGCCAACRSWRRRGDRVRIIGFRVCLVRDPASTAAAERRDPEGEVR